MIFFEKANYNPTHEREKNVSLAFESLEGRVKTLHPKIHAGILNKRSNKSHQNQMKKNDFENIDLVIVNFYPFENTLKNTTNHKELSLIHI